MKVISTDIRTVGYDPHSQTLEVELRDLRIFRYYGVPSALYGGFVAAASHGDFYLRFVKDCYESERIF